MKKRIFRVVAGLLVLSVVPVGLLVFAFALPPQYGDTFLGALPDKCDALENTPGKRVVVIGGSGTAFGLRCDLLEQALPGYSAVNFGMYAGLGTAVMLDLALPRLREGDVVIFSPEQSEQTLSTYLGAEYLWQGTEGRPDLLADLRREDLGKMLGSFPCFAAQKARFFRDGSPGGEGAYAHASFNAWGDIDYPNRGSNIMTGGWDRNMPICFDTDLPRQDFLDRFNEFAEACEGKGVTVYYRFCPMNASAVLHPEDGEAYRQHLAEKLLCPILGDVQDAILDQGWFYDTNFHLNSAGAVLNTARLAGELQTALGAAGEDIPVPPMPKARAVPAVDGDYADEDAFRYSEAEDGLMIVGLTEAGMARAAITLPVSHGGKPVLGFTAEVFAGNTQIEEITIQENITSIPDGAFAGCASLLRIHMENPSPSACTVGAGLLEGTDAWVYIPQESLGAYLTNYFWSVHGSRIRTGVSGEKAPPETAEPETPREETIRQAVPAGNIRYQGNGGATRSGETCVDCPMDTAHLRTNTALGTRYFTRPGYVPTGWNTEPDGSGTHIGFGSRVERCEGMVLYVQWEAETPETCFRWQVREDAAWITGYSGTEETCAVPEQLDGLPVRGICAGAFAGAQMKTLVLSSQLRILEAGAFTGCGVEEVYLFDSLTQISDETFSGCENLAVIHLNAATSPVFSASYYAAFADKYDRLLSLGGQRKLVLFSGSSTRYAYDSPAIEAAYPQYAVVNMGVFAYTNAMPQLELIRAHMEAGDVLFHAPEFDALRNQFCADNTIDHHFWAMMEANYDAAAELDLRGYTGVFDGLQEYLRLHAGMPKLSYTVSPNGFDDDGNRYLFATYNAYGDFVLPRPNGQRDEMLHTRADYTPEPFQPELLDAMNNQYRKFLERGITVLFTYTPRNRSSLTEGSVPAEREALDRLLREALCVPIISEMEASLYSGVYFYLIDSHLSTEGAKIFTQRIITDLAPWL